MSRRGVFLQIFSTLVVSSFAFGQEAASDPPAAANEQHALPMTASAEERIAYALDQKIDLDFTEMPLSDVAAFLAKKADVEVVLNHRTLDEAGLGADVPITFQSSGVRLRSALHRMLADVELTWVVRDKAIELTTEEDAETLQVTRAYSVREIAAQADDPAVLDFDSLIEAITASIDPEGWEDVGGPGSIRAFGDVLAVSNTDQVQRQVEAFVKAAGELKKRYAEKPDAAVNEAIDAAPASSDAALREKVAAARVSVDFAESSLADAVFHLSELTKLPLRFDTRELDGMGIGTDVPVSCQATDVPLPVALSRMLRELELTWVVDHEVLLITSLDSAESQRLVRIYPVRDLVAGVEESGEPINDLEDFLVSMVAPELWDDAGGPGSIVAVPTLEALVIAQSEEVHAKVATVISTLRSATPLAKAAPVGEEGEAASRAKIKVYRMANGGEMPGEMLTQLTGLIPQLVAPDSWASDGVVITPLSGALVVRQTPAVHREISKVLITMGLPLTPHGGFFQSFGGGMAPGMTGGTGGMGGGAGGIFDVPASNNSR